MLRILKCQPPNRGFTNPPNNMTPEYTFLSSFCQAVHLVLLHSTSRTALLTTQSCHALTQPPNVIPNVHTVERCHA
eukprot:3204049-Pyramimonas_sp.AAC.1